MAGVSSFGFSGTNCHVVVTEPPRLPKEDPSAADMHLLVLSANKRPSLTRLAKATLGYLGKAVNGDSVSMASVCWAMSNGRAALPHRVAIVANSAVSLLLSAQIVDSAQLEPFDVVILRFHMHSISRRRTPTFN